MSEWAAYIPLRDSLEDFEKEFNVSLPSDLKEIIQKYNKGCPLKNKIPLGKGYMEIYRFISFNRTGLNNIYALMKLFEGKKIVPFAMTENNKYICLKDGKVIIYNVENDKETNLCSSVTELLQMLK